MSFDFDPNDSMKKANLIIPVVLVSIVVIAGLVALAAVLR